MQVRVLNVLAAVWRRQAADAASHSEQGNLIFEPSCSVASKARQPCKLAQQT